MTKRSLAFILILVLILPAALCSCARADGWSDDGRIRVLSTVFPSYDFARAIGGDAVDARMLIRPGSNMHSYEPTAADTILIQECDIFIYVGGESDAWVSRLLSSIDTEGMIVISLCDVADHLLEEEHVHTEECDEEHAHHEHEAAYDEHVWTSFANAAEIVKAIEEAISACAPAQSSTFGKNANTYLDELSALEAEYRRAVDSAARKTLFFGDRFPMLYLVRELGLDYRAAFSGCSTVTEPTVSALIHLIEEARALDSPVILYMESSEHSHKTADHIAEEVGAETRMLHSGHSLSREEFEAGVSYLDLLRQNLVVIREALKS